MARRTLINLDERILLETIRLGAKDGLGKISAKTLANNCDITDTTVFTHFQNKPNLIQSAARYINDKLAVIVKSYVSSGDPNYAYPMWNAVIEYLLTNPDQALYISGFRHSIYYTPQFRLEKDYYVDMCRQLLADRINKLTDDKCIMVWNYVIDCTLTVARRITQGLIPNTEESKVFLYNLMIGQLLSNS